jgi:hypothetical protein
MLTVLRQALALLVPAHHCVEGTIVLVANKQGFGSRTAATSTENGSIHQILANIINVAEYISFKSTQIYLGCSHHPFPQIYRGRLTTDYQKAKKLMDWKYGCNNGNSYEIISILAYLKLF